MQLLGLGFSLRHEQAVQPVLRAIEPILKQNRALGLGVFVVWEPRLPTDWSRPSRLVQHRIPDPRALQFWYKNHLVT